MQEVQALWHCCKKFQHYEANATQMVAPHYDPPRSKAISEVMTEYLDDLRDDMTSQGKQLMGWMDLGMGLKDFNHTWIAQHGITSGG